MPAKTDIAQVEARNRGLAVAAARLCDARRAADVLVLDLRKICGYTDYFVIASATSSQQLRGVAREIEKAMKLAQATLLSYEGAETGGWVLLDYGDVIVHLFSHEMRDHYQLESLWGDAELVDWARA